MATIRIVAEVKAEKADVEHVIRAALEEYRNAQTDHAADLATNILRNLRIIRID